jgi:hypothetical protein
VVVIAWLLDLQLPVQSVTFTFYLVFVKYFSKHVAVRFIWWKKLEYPEKTTDLPKVTDKLYDKIKGESH